MSVDMVTRIGLGTQKIKLKRREIFFSISVASSLALVSTQWLTQRVTGAVSKVVKRVELEAGHSAKLQRNNCTYISTFHKLSSWPINMQILIRLKRYETEHLKFQRARRSRLVAFCDDIWINWSDFFNYRSLLCLQQLAANVCSEPQHFSSRILYFKK